MTWGRRAVEKPPKPSRLRRRLEGTSTDTLLAWVGVSLNSIGQATDDYRYNRDPIALAEAKREAEVVLAVLETLTSRHEGSPS